MSEVQESAPQVRITISAVLQQLDLGKSRKEIAIHFGQTQSAMQKMVWSHPKLKARKAKKQYADLIILEDDMEDAVVEVQNLDVVEAIEVASTSVEETEEVEEEVENSDSPWN